MSATINVELFPAEVEVVRRPIVGDGGHQRFLRLLTGRLSDAGRLSMTLEEFDKVVRYATAYGQGGYQDRYRVIMGAAQRAGLEG